MPDDYLITSDASMCGVFAVFPTSSLLAMLLGVWLLTSGSFLPPMARRQPFVQCAQCKVQLYSMYLLVPVRVV